MSIRNLDHLFRPESVALIGATNRPGSVGSVLARNLFKSGFDGPIMPVNPSRRAIHGVLAYPDIGSLPVVPDLAVIATPPDTVAGVIDELGARGTRAAIVITAGFGEGNSETGASRKQAVLDAARPHLLRVLGPNCLGLLSPGSGLNASFSHLAPRPGRLAFLTQSGAIVTSVLDWAEQRRIGFSHLVSLGGMADVDFGDLLDYLANDRETGAILMYVEAVTHARKFLSAARAAARMKPVILVKSGRHEEGARAAASHTGALAGADAVYDAAIRRAGMLRVNTLGELFAAAETLAMGEPPRGDRLAILTNGGGMGVLATDALIDQGGRLAELSGDTLARLDAVLPTTWSHGNPVDIIGDAPGERYADALRLLNEAPEVDAVLALNCPTAVADGRDAARAVIEVREEFARRQGRPALFTSWVGAHTAEGARRLFSERGIPTYATPEGAVRAFTHMVTFRANQHAMLETPPSVPEAFTPDIAGARAVMERARAAGRDWLSEPEAKEVLGAYGVPVVPTRLAADIDAAAACAEALGGPLALKIVSGDITHKSDVGGVALDLADAGAVRDAAAAMLRRVGQRQPDARIDGFSVQRMVRRPDAWELIAGITEDAQFGPVILFGQGGTAVEVVRDQALALPPLNMKLARELMARTRIHRQLVGYRDRAPAALDQIALTLIRLAQLAADLDEVIELDINPLLADADGALALDARIRLRKAHEQPRRDRLAIRAYPRDLEETVRLDDGRAFLLRPIRPEDEPALQEAFGRLSAAEIGMRFHAPMKRLDHMAAARFTQLDYDREMALVLTDPPDHGPHHKIYGAVHLSADPDNEEAEYSIIVLHELTGRGLGQHLMERIIEYARQRGIRRVVGDVLRDNGIMLRLCEQLGFRRRNVADEPGLVRVTLELQS